MVDVSAQPTPLPDSVTEIVHAGTTYYIIGTAHVSQRSVDEVRTVIDTVKPDVVCVELDKTRHDTLTKDSAFRDLDVFKVVREGRTLYLLAHLALASYQRRIGASLGVKPGAELLAACQMAAKRNIPVELIDRDINITLKRTWSNIGLWKRSMLLSSLVVGFGEDDEDATPVTADTVEELKEPKALSEMLTELGRAIPQVKKPLIDERDQYMASRMVEVGTRLSDLDGELATASHRRTGKRSVVGVVGAAHVPGMKEHWGEPIDRAALEQIPPPSLAWRLVKWMIPALFIVAFILGWQSSKQTTFLEMMLAWIVPTAVGAAFATLVAGGSFLSVLAALVVAPVAAIHPLLGTGMVVGVVEAWRRKPNVADCEQLPEDIQTFRGFWRNPVTRILLIAVASGIGTLVGFWVGVGWVASLL